MTKITISRALREVARIKSELKDWTARRSQVVSHKAEAIPAYEFATANKEVARLTEELVGLQTRIAIANATTCVTTDDIEPPVLARVINTLSQIKSEIDQLQKLNCLAVNEVCSTEQRYVGTAGYVDVQVQHISHLTIRERDELVSQHQKVFMFLNDLVEQANHSTLC